MSNQTEKVIDLNPKNQETFKSLFTQKQLIQQQIEMTACVILDTLDIPSSNVKFKFSEDFTKIIIE